MNILNVFRNTAYALMGLAFPFYPTFLMLWLTKKMYNAGSDDIGWFEAIGYCTVFLSLFTIQVAILGWIS